MSKKPKFEVELQKLKVRVSLLAWFMVLGLALAFVFILSDSREPQDSLEVISVNGYESAPYETKSYVCTSGVIIEDLREGCKPYRCELWFKGQGECAVIE